MPDLTKIESADVPIQLYPTTGFPPEILSIFNQVLSYSQTIEGFIETCKV